MFHKDILWYFGGFQMSLFCHSRVGIFSTTLYVLFHHSAASDSIRKIDICNWSTSYAVQSAPSNTTSVNFSCPTFVIYRHLRGFFKQLLWRGPLSQNLCLKWFWCFSKNCLFFHKDYHYDSHFHRRFWKTFPTFILWV